MPVTQMLPASRNATWAPTLAYNYAGGALPLAGAHIAMQLRQYGAAPYDAQATIAAIPFADALTGGTPGQPDEVRTLSLYPVLTPAQLGDMPAGPEAGDPLTLVFDIRITYADGVSEILSSGTFVLSPGVTLA